MADELKVDIDLVAIDAADYTFEPAGFDLIVLLYHLDRRLLLKIVSAMSTGALLHLQTVSGMGFGERAGKRSFQTTSEKRTPGTRAGIADYPITLNGPVRNWGVVEFVGKKSDSEKR